MNFIASIFDKSDVWNNLLSLVVSLLTILTTTFSVYGLIRSMVIEDPIKYAFRDNAEKDPHDILKTIILTSMFLALSLILGLFLIWISSLNLSLETAIDSYIFFAILFFVFGTYLSNKNKFIMKLEYRFYNFIYYKKNNRYKNERGFTRVLIILPMFFFVFIFNIISRISFIRNNIIYIVIIYILYGFLMAFTIRTFINIKENQVSIKVIGYMCTSISIELILGLLYYIKINQNYLLKNDIYVQLNILDYFFENIIMGIQVSIDNYIKILLFIFITFSIFYFIVLNNLLISKYYNRKELAYYYIFTSENNGRDRNKLFVFGKIDNKFICNTRSYIKCNEIEQKEFFKRINCFRAKMMELKFTSVSDKTRYYKFKVEKLNKIIEGLFYYSRYLRVEELAVKAFFDTLDEFNIAKFEDLYNCGEYIKTKFEEFDDKISIKFINIDDIENGKLYNYYENLNIFYNIFNRQNIEN